MSVDSTSDLSKARACTAFPLPDNPSTGGESSSFVRRLERGCWVKLGGYGESFYRPTKARLPLLPAATLYGGGTFGDAGVCSFVCRLSSCGSLVCEVGGAARA